VGVCMCDFCNGWMSIYVGVCVLCECVDFVVDGSVYVCMCVYVWVL